MSSSMSDRNKVYSTGCSLAVNKGNGSSKYSEAPWYYFLTSLICESGFTLKANTNFGPGGNHLPCASRTGML